MLIAPFIFALAGFTLRFSAIQFTRTENIMPNSKSTLRILILVFLVNSIVSLVLAQDSTTTENEAMKPAAEKRKLKKELQAFEPFVGSWTIDAKWSGGSELWARNEYSVGMNGNFVEAKTFTKNEHGKEYQRYFTIWRHNAENKKVESYGFTFDGSVTNAISDMDTSDAEHPVIRSKWRTADSKSYIKQEVRLIDAKSYGWKVWSSEDGEEWTQIMDGVWKKKE